MRIFCWVIFWFSFGPLNGWVLEKKNIHVSFAEAEDSILGLRPLEVVPQTITNATSEVLGYEDDEKTVITTKEKVLVIKGDALNSVLDKVRSKHRDYNLINRYERSFKKPSRGMQNTRERRLDSTIRVSDKPLVLGGSGFGNSSLESKENKLHFTFNSHLKASNIYSLEKNDATNFDFDFKKARSEKFLIFHKSSSSFGHQVSLSEISEEPMQQKTVYLEMQKVPSSWVFSDAHVKDFQNKKTSIRLLPAKKTLDLIYDNPAILQHDYQMFD